MRISDWSSDVCSSDLFAHRAHATGSRADRRADVTDFRQRRIQHTPGKLVVKPLGDAEHTAPGVVFTGRAGATGAVPIGRASWRGRWGQYAYISVEAVLLKKKTPKRTNKTT